ncbi:MAG: M23 family metallopeptidase [Dehalococcoidia bacterium]
MTRFAQTRHDGLLVRGLPLDGVATSVFGARDMDAHAAGHSGLDLAAEGGTAVRVPADGVVRDVFSLAIAGAPWAQAWKAVFGNSVILDHGDVVTLYAHLDRPPEVYEGQRVRAGDVLGVVGATGQATGPHLHWGMAPASNPYLQRDGPGGLVDPLDFAVDEDAPAEQQAASVDLDAVRARLREALALLG